MEDLRIRREKELPHNISADGIRYPPNSVPPSGINHSQKIRGDFSAKGASMLPKLQDFNQMFRDKANSLIEMNTNVLPPELSQQVGWWIGTQHNYSLQKNGTIIISSNPSPPEK